MKRNLFFFILFIIFLSGGCKICPPDFSVLPRDTLSVTLKTDTVYTVSIDTQFASTEVTADFFRWAENGQSWIWATDSTVVEITKIDTIFRVVTKILPKEVSVAVYKTDTVYVQCPPFSTPQISLKTEQWKGWSLNALWVLIIIAIGIYGYFNNRNVR